MEHPLSALHKSPSPGFKSPIRVRTISFIPSSCLPALKQHDQKEISMLTIKGSRQTIFRDYEKLNAPINNLYPTGDGVSKGANCMNVKV